MKAIEFLSQAKDGNIKIPKKYLKNLKKEFRVIILIDENTKDTVIKKKHLSALQITTKDFKFNRDEANER